MSNYEELMNKRCSACGGTGKQDSHYGLDSDPCESCDGTGMLLVPYEPPDEY